MASDVVSSFAIMRMMFLVSSFAIMRMMFLVTGSMKQWPKPGFMYSCGTISGRDSSTLKVLVSGQNIYIWVMGSWLRRMP